MTYELRLELHGSMRDSSVHSTLWFIQSPLLHGPFLHLVTSSSLLLQYLLFYLFFIRVSQCFCDRRIGLARSNGLRGVLPEDGGRWLKNLLRIRVVPVLLPSRKPAILTEVFRAFSQLIQANDGIVP
jgi:hypothetical protein